MNLSYWETETFFNKIDALVIGSGIVGLNAAIRLKELNPKWVVKIMERGPLPTGASTRNAGFACFGSISELLADLQYQSESEVMALVERRWNGLTKLRTRLGDDAIGYRHWGGYELFCPEEEERFKACVEILPEINRYMESMIGKDAHYQIVDEQITTLGFQGVSHLIEQKAEGQIHTGKMMRALLDYARNLGIEVFNGVEITDIQASGKTVHIQTNHGWSLDVPKAIVATNGFARQLFPDLSVIPARNQVLLTSPLAKLPFKGCFHYNEGYVYFRNIGQRILLGGGRNLDHDGETTDQFGLTELIQTYLEGLLADRILPNQDYTIEQRWSGILGIGSVKKPIVEKMAPNLVAAVRLGGMGIAIGSLLGEEAAELLVGL